jgi:outer membrane receptor protein involved in Fe transport
LRPPNIHFGITRNVFVKYLVVSALCVAISLSRSVGAEQYEAEASRETLEITATRVPEEVEKVPASITIVTGEELRLRGANDLRTALSLVAGVEGTPGGDSGPAGSVPALWGLREADAFLLVVDGVPWGGAFNPATPSIDMTNVERIEVLRGAAPTIYGATSFVGVIQVIHYSAGSTPSFAALSAASYGGVAASGAADLPDVGSYHHSLTANFEKRGYAEDRTEYQRYHALYRGQSDLGFGTFHVDGDISILPQDPSGNMLLLDGTTLHTELPIDANYNPAGAKLDQQRYALNLGLDGTASLGNWSVTLSATRTLNDVLRGFLRGNAFADPPDAGVGDGFQADGYTQSTAITDIYFDAHLASTPAPNMHLMYGVDYLYGYGAENAINFGYCVDGGGHEYACDGAHHSDELVYSDDQRGFAGAYAQLDWQVSPTVDVLAGIRLNHTRETADGVAIDNTGAAPVLAFDGSDERTTTRLSGMVGASWRSWASGNDNLIWYADYRNSFKPLAIDFGPEAEVDILEPETGVSVELGAKSELLNGHLSLDASIFRMDFRNGLTFTQDASGEFGPANGGKSRFEGFEVEARLRMANDWQLAANYAQHNARFVDFINDGGLDVSGNRIEMSPHQLASLGLLYAPASGLSGSLVANYIGSRELDLENLLSTGSYTTLDASLNYTLGHYRLQLTGYNLTNVRDPVAASELNESVTVTQTAGYYRLPARSARFEVRYGF